MAALAFQAERGVVVSLALAHACNCKSYLVHGMGDPSQDECASAGQASRAVA